MCYSAQIQADLSRYQRLTGARISIEEFIELYWIDHGKPPPRRHRRTPRAMELSILRDGPLEVAELIRAQDAHEVIELERELFAQRKRVADAQRSLAQRPTKKAVDEVRIGNGKIAQALRRLEGLKRAEATPEDARIYPGYAAPVLVIENGERVIKPMRYQCRPAGKPAAYDQRYPGTYSARRDNLAGFWRGQFGHSHGVLVAEAFFEHVEVDGERRILAFRPSTGEPMLIACLWSRWTDPAGHAPDLLSFAAITDEPEPEVAATGHDRTVINLRPEHLEAWLAPDPNNLNALQHILDDKQRPYYVHQVAA